MDHNATKRAPTAQRKGGITGPPKAGNGFGSQVSPAGFWRVEGWFQGKSWFCAFFSGKKPGWFVSVSRYKWEKWKKIPSEYMGGTCDLPGNLHIPWKRNIITATFKGLFARAILVSGSVLFQVITFITSGKDFHFCWWGLVVHKRLKID